MVQVLDSLFALVPFVYFVGGLFWITRIPAPAQRSQIQSCRFQLADAVSLGILLQVAIAASVVDYQRFIAYSPSSESSIVIMVGVLTPAVIVLWWMSVRHLERTGVRNGLRRIGFSTVFLPIVVIFCVETTLAGADALRPLSPRLAAELFPYEYQHIGVGHSPLSVQLPLLLAGFGVCLLGIVLLRLLHVKLLRLDQIALPNPAQKPAESPANP